MSKPRKTLFDPVVSQEKLHPLFNQLHTSPGGEPARWMLDDVYQALLDPEGNFLEQFQTTGFDARHFELYLFAYFSRSGFTVERKMPNPDFIISRGGVRVAVEATTVNPPTRGGVLEKQGSKISNLSQAEMIDYQRHELPIRFGSPLFSKLQKRYWELEHCKDLPFVLAIEAFHEEHSLVMSDWSLVCYLFGLEQSGSWGQGGRLRIKTSPIKEHKVGEKLVPSNFFEQPETENISAILFTNSGTSAKFSRMGYQHGIGCDTIDMARSGFCFNPHPDAMDPTFFCYNLSEPPFVEHWGQGLVVLHNPNARSPLPMDFFLEAVQGYLEDGVVKTDCPAWHPISSTTLILSLGEMKQKILKIPTRSPRFAVAAIAQEHFEELRGFAVRDDNAIFQEDGWFSDESISFLGVVIRDNNDDDWGFVILGRDEYFQFRAVEMEASLPTREQAREGLQIRISKLLSSPQRIFPQGIESTDGERS